MAESVTKTLLSIEPEKSDQSLGMLRQVVCTWIPKVAFLRILRLKLTLWQFCISFGEIPETLRKIPKGGKEISANDYQSRLRRFFCAGKHPKNHTIWRNSPKKPLPQQRILPSVMRNLLCFVDRVSSENHIAFKKWRSPVLYRAFSQTEFVI